MIDERRLDQFGFHIQIKQFGLEFAQFIGSEHLFSPFPHICENAVEVVIKFWRVPADFFQRFVKGQALPCSGGEVDFLALIGNLGAFADFSCDMAEQILGKIHEIPEGGVRPVEFAHGEFRVVPDGNAFVAEIAVDFKNLLKAPHKQPLEIQLGRDAHVQLHVERVVVRDERAGRRSSRNGVQHGRFHFHKAALFQKPAEFADDLAAFAENFPDLRVHDKIKITLAIANFHIG